MFLRPSGQFVKSAGVEAAAREAADVVREADEEQEDHEHEAEHPGLLHHAIRDGTAAHLLDQAPEDVAPVERQEREQVDDREREADHRQQQERPPQVLREALASGLVAPHDPRDLLAVLGVEDPRERGERSLRDVPHLVDREVCRPGRARMAWLAERDPDEHPLGLRVVFRPDPHGHGAAVPLDREDDRGRRLAALDEPAGALVARDPVAEGLELFFDVARRSALSVDGDDPVAVLELALGGSVLGDREDLGRDLRRAEREREQDQEGDQHVHRRPRGDHDDPLPDRLVVVGARGDVRRKLLLRVHAGDLHEPAEWDRSDPVLGLAHLLADDQGREEEREALDPHARPLGHDEVPELVQDDERREARERQKPAHAVTARRSTRPVARRRASASAS